MLACMILHLKRASLDRAWGLFERFEWPNWPVQRSLLGLGLPIGISLFAETSMFALIAVLIGSLGAVVVASHQVTLSLSSLVFMVPFSLGLAITVRVGHNLGMHGARTALFSAKVGIAVALFCATVSATALLLLAEQDRKSTRLNSSHVRISYAVFCLKKKKKKKTHINMTATRVY